MKHNLRTTYKRKLLTIVLDPFDPSLTPVIYWNGWSCDLTVFKKDSGLHKKILQTMRNNIWECTPRGAA